MKDQKLITLRFFLTTALRNSFRRSERDSVGCVVALIRELEPLKVSVAPREVFFSGHSRSKNFNKSSYLSSSTFFTQVINRLRILGKIRRIYEKEILESDGTFFFLKFDFLRDGRSFGRTFKPCLFQLISLNYHLAVSNLKISFFVVNIR